MKSFSEIREAWETKKGIEIKRKANTDVEEVKKYTPPTKAEIEADKKKDNKGKPRPSMSVKSITKKLYGK